MLIDMERARVVETPSSGWEPDALAVELRSHKVRADAGRLLRNSEQTNMNGHSDHLIKTCAHCRRQKTIEDFHVQSQKTDGRHPVCKECRSREHYRDLRSRTSHYLWKQAKQRAKERGLQFEISVDDIIIPDKCPITGIPLSVSDGLWSNTSPSLDRIDNSKGYTPGNIAVISFLANNFKADYGLAEMEHISSHIDDLISYMRGVSA